MKAQGGLRIAQTHRLAQRLALNASLQTSLHVLRLDAIELGRYLHEQAEAIPALKLGPRSEHPGAWLPRWTGVMPGQTQVMVDLPAEQGPSLMSHVIERLPGLVPAGPLRRIALALAEALKPSGWLGTDPATLAAELGVSPGEVETVLAQLQAIDPPGLFARNLQECLTLQARAEGELDAVLQVLLENLHRVAAAEWGELARIAGVSPEEIQRGFAKLRSLNPKPGTAFSTLASPIREPDLKVVRDGKTWVCELNRSSLPTLTIDEDGEGASKAQALLRLVEQRNTTLLQVGRAVLAHQRAALEDGPRALRPLTMQAIADELSLHKSTISRVVAGTAVDTPHGTWWLRALFSPDMGGDTGAAALKARLAQLIADEDKTAPLSDDALATALSDAETVVARRTVAKYRSALRIAPAHRRRQRIRS